MAKGSQNNSEANSQASSKKSASALAGNAGGHSGEGDLTSLWMLDRRAVKIACLPPRIWTRKLLEDQKKGFLQQHLLYEESMRFYIDVDKIKAVTVHSLLQPRLKNIIATIDLRNTSPLTLNCFRTTKPLPGMDLLPHLQLVLHIVELSQNIKDRVNVEAECRANFDVLIKAILDRPEENVAVMFERSLNVPSNPLSTVLEPTAKQNFDYRQKVITELERYLAAHHKYLEDEHTWAKTNSKNINGGSNLEGKTYAMNQKSLANMAIWSNPDVDKRTKTTKTYEEISSTFIAGGPDALYQQVKARLNTMEIVGAKCDVISVFKLNLAPASPKVQQLQDVMKQINNEQYNEFAFVRRTEAENKGDKGSHHGRFESSVGRFVVEGNTNDIIGSSSFELNQRHLLRDTFQNAIAKALDDLKGETGFAVPARESHDKELEEPTLLVPLLIGEYKRPTVIFEPHGPNQTRIYLVSAVHYLAAAGITEFPVYGICTEGTRAAIVCAWGERQQPLPSSRRSMVPAAHAPLPPVIVRVMERDPMVFDIADGTDALHFASFLDWLRVKHKVSLENKLRELKAFDAYVEMAENAKRGRPGWASKKRT